MDRLTRSKPVVCSGAGTVISHTCSCSRQAGSPFGSATRTRHACPACLQVRFLDPEVAYWQTATQHYMVNGSSSHAPSAVNVHALDGTR